MTLLNLFRLQGDKDLAYLKEQARLVDKGVRTPREEYEFYGEGGTWDHLQRKNNGL